MTTFDGIVIRTNLRAGDLGAMIRLHGIVYAREQGFDPTFEAYVAGPLAEFARKGSVRERLWIAERAGHLVGCIAIVEAAPSVAQLRWFLVAPEARGVGLGKHLLREAITFARECGNRCVILWTVSALTAAAQLYTTAGFRKTEEKSGRMWGVDVVEEKYEMAMR
jgi:GNAT superfamily N-acetyltransferase